MIYLVCIVTSLIIGTVVGLFVLRHDFRAAEAQPDFSDLVFTVVSSWLLWPVLVIFVLGALSHHFLLGQTTSVRANINARGTAFARKIANK